MRAYPYLWGQSKATNERAIPLLQDAIAIDPAYGRAHAFLSWCYAQHLGYIWTDEPERDLERSLKAVEAAVGSIDDDPTALTAVGGALSHCGDQERAAAYLERAIALDPNNAWAWHFLLRSCGRGRAEAGHGSAVVPEWIRAFVRGA